MKQFKNILALAMLLATALSVVTLTGGGQGRVHARFDDRSTPATEVNAEPCALLEPPPQLPPQQEAQVRRAAQQTLNAYNARQTAPSTLEIRSIWGQGDWAVAECVFRLEGDPAAGSDGVVMLLVQTGERWQAALPGDDAYSARLDRIPERYMAPTVKDQMEALNMVAPETVDPSDGIYRLPYPDGASVYITRDSDQHGGPIDMWSSNGAVVAAADGWVVGVPRPAAVLITVQPIVVRMSISPYARPAGRCASRVSATDREDGSTRSQATPTPLKAAPATVAALPGKAPALQTRIRTVRPDSGFRSARS